MRRLPAQPNIPHVHIWMEKVHDSQKIPGRRQNRSQGFMPGS